MRISVLIPALNPGPALRDLVDELLSMGLPVTVVNDGSTRGREIFARLASLPEVTVLTHPVNRGKGAALKTGLAHLRQAGFEGAVTADADGQHAPEDIRRTAEALARSPDSLVLGVRDTAKMPSRSRVGNRIVIGLLRGLYNIRVRDGQTGLRGIPLTLPAVDEILTLPGDRFQYEMVQLREAYRLFPGGIREVPVDTLYAPDRQPSSFRSLRDGIPVAMVLLQKLPGFILSSMSAFALDYLIFNLLYYLVFPTFSGVTFVSTVTARLCSCTYNFMVNKHVLFKNSSSAYNAKSYATLAATVLLANLVLMHLLVDLLHLPAFIIKVLVDLLLFVVNFTVQHKLARRREK